MGHHRPARETPLNGVCWCADDGPTLNAGLHLVASRLFWVYGPVLLENPIVGYILPNGSVFEGFLLP